jgi:hypothetical protein
MWLQPSSRAIRSIPYPNPFNCSITATSSGVCVTSLRAHSPRPGGRNDPSILSPSSSVRGSTSYCRQDPALLSPDTGREVRAKMAAAEQPIDPGVAPDGEGAWHPLMFL